MSVTAKTALAGKSFASSADSMATIREVPPMTRLAIRGRGGVEARTEAVLGFSLPTAVCSSAINGANTALWLSPDEWLVLAPDGESERLFKAVDEALTGLPHAVVDISHRNTALEVSGPKAAFLLNHGCPLDFDLAAFPVGMSTRTLVAKSEVVIWRKAETVFHVEVWRSFAPYLADYLVEARREFER